MYLDEEAAKPGRFGGLVALPAFVVKLRGDIDIDFGVPIRPGDVITATSTIAELYEKTGRSGSMWFVVSRQHLTNQNGEMVADVACSGPCRSPIPAQADH